MKDKGLEAIPGPFIRRPLQLPRGAEPPLWDPALTADVQMIDDDVGFTPGLGKRNRPVRPLWWICLILQLS